MSLIIYKICTRTEWDAARQSGEYAGAAVDLADGFIHFSAAHQVAETAERHFTGQNNLVLVCVAANQLRDSLKWEVSRGGDRFPHLYGAFPMDAVVQTHPLPLGEDGKHIFPAGIVS